MRDKKKCEWQIRGDGIVSHNTLGTIHVIGAGHRNLISPKSCTNANDEAVTLV